MITKVQYIDLEKLSIEEGTGGHMNFPGKGYKVDFGSLWIGQDADR